MKDIKAINEHTKDVGTQFHTPLML